MFVVQEFVGGRDGDGAGSTKSAEDEEDEEYTNWG